MSELLKLADGRVVRVHGEVEAISQEELQSVHDDLLREADAINQFIDAPVADDPSQDQPAPAEQPVAPSAPTPEAPVAPEAAPAPAVADPSVITDQSAVAEQPIVPAPQVTVTEAVALPPADAPVIQ